MRETVRFTVYGRPEPQGSKKAFPNRRTGHAIIVEDNRKTKPYRQQVTSTAIAETNWNGNPVFGKHVPVRMELAFYFARPGSVPKKRLFPVVKPDLDKLYRATGDALTGVLYADDAQIVASSQEKFYGSPERVEITVRAI